MELFCVLLALGECLVYPLEKTVIEPQALEDACKLSDELRLREILLLALPFAEGATVVDVFLFLDLGGDQAPAVSARHELGERELAALVYAGLVARKHPLYFFEEFSRDDGRMVSLEKLALPAELPVVERVLEDQLDRALGRLGLSAVIAEAHLDHEAPDIRDGVLARGIELECPPYDRGEVGVELDFSFVSVVQVPGRRLDREVSRLRLFEHAFGDLLGEVVRVVLGKEQLEAVNELLMRARLRVQPLAFLHQVDITAKVGDRHVVLKVAIEPVRLLDQDVPGFRMLNQEVQHGLELLSPRLLGGLNVLEDSGDLNAFPLCVGLQ